MNLFDCVVMTVVSTAICICLPKGLMLFNDYRASRKSDETKVA